MITDYLNGVKQTRHNHYVALCPCHKEKTPSLSITIADDGKTICHCFGCGANGLDVVDALGLTTGELFPDDGDFNREEYQAKKQKQFLKAQFMSDYVLIQIGESWLKIGRKFTRHDREVFKAAINRINEYKFNAHKVYEDLIRQEYIENALNCAYFDWTNKTISERYHK